MSHRKLLGFGLLVLVGADLVLAIGEHPALLFVGVALWGVHMGMTQGLLATMVADTAPAHMRGTAYGLFNLVSGVAMLVASLLAGIVWDRYGPSWTFYVGAGLCTIALFALAWKPNRGPDQHARTIEAGG